MIRIILSIGILYGYNNIIIITTGRSGRWCPKNRSRVETERFPNNAHGPRASRLRSVAGYIFTADYSPPPRDRSFRCLSIRRIRDLSRLLRCVIRVHPVPIAQTPSSTHLALSYTTMIIIIISMYWYTMDASTIMCIIVYASIHNIVRRVYLYNIIYYCSFAF